ncbi:MAG TPA: hypothetical protein ENK91_11805, partial [Bacteroidetes bacterium]|nr:hypothetical protein [Bacteroidota bacterium]
MKKSIHKFNKIIQKVLVYSLIIATLIFVGLLYPNRAYFNYEYILGSKWRYETLQAPFNFPIKKSLEDINAEKQNIKDSFVPRYKKDNSYQEYLLNYVDNISLDSVSESGASNLKSFLKKEINKIYSNGVLNASDFNSKLDNGLIILNNNKSEKVNKSDVFTPEKAKEYLKTKINLLFPKFEYIVNSIEIKPNLIYDEELNNKILEEKLS